MGSLKWSVGKIQTLFMAISIYSLAWKKCSVPDHIKHKSEIITKWKGTSALYHCTVTFGVEVRHYHSFEHLMFLLAEIN